MNLDQNQELDSKTEKSKMYHVRFLDKEEMKWYTLTDEKVSREEAEKIYNEQTYHGSLYYPKSEDSLLFEINEA